MKFEKLNHTMENGLDFSRKSILDIKNAMKSKSFSPTKERVIPARK